MERLAHLYNVNLSVIEKCLEYVSSKHNIDKDNIIKYVLHYRLKIGIIFHWGIYSVPAYDDMKSVYRRKMKNGSEWYLKRLTETGTYRPISGYKETQRYHEETYGALTYNDLADYFTADKWNPDDWMEICVKNKVTYVILTVKHHDGFCLWDTKTTKFNCVAKGPKINILEKFKKSAINYGLVFGIYYSWSEFGKNCTKEYVNKVIAPQIHELEKYKPDIWWFDGHWECKSKYAIDKMNELCKYIKTGNPNVEINDRLGDKKLYENPTYLGESTYRVYSDRYIPEDIPECMWEHINTIGFSWGINKQQKTKDYKSGEDLFDLYKTVKSKNGRFLLNMGPCEDGSLDKNEVKSLNEFGKLL
jgi:alpha-L-fucosidase